MTNRGIQMESLHNDDKAMIPGSITVEPVWVETKTRRLPYISLYLAWSLCFLSVLVSAFFTFFYSLQWGGEKSNKWLTSFLLSTGETITVINTGQVQ